MIATAFLKFAGWAWGILSEIPAKVWLYLGLVLSVVLFHFHLQGQAVDAAVGKERAVWVARDAARVVAQKKADDIAQARLNDAQRAAVQAQLDASEAHAADEAKRVSDLAELRKRMPAYVSTLAIPAGDAPRGYVLWRAAAAAFANGADFAAPPGPAEGPLNGPSGVSFATLAETDAAQADAFRAATEWGRGWQTYARILKNACQSQLDILTTKGSQ